MSTPEDPYRPPAAALEGVRGREWGSRAVPESVVTILAQTRPWVRLLALLIFVGFGLLVVASLGLTIAGLGMSGGAMRAVALLPMLVAALLYLVPALYLWRYAASIAELQAGGGQAALEAALGHQKSLWKFAGILALVVLAIYAVALVFGFLLAPLLR